MFERIANKLFGSAASEKAGRQPESPEELQAAMAEACKEKGGALLLLCGSVENSYGPFLAALGAGLYGRGLADSGAIARTGLLTILSGTVPLETVADRLTGAGGKREIHCVEGFHRWEYDRAAASRLLQLLQKRVEEGRLQTILVLNIPQTVCREVKREFPRLWSSAILYADQPLQENQGRAKAPAFWHKQPAPGQTPPQRSQVPGEQDKPWYLENTGLLAREKQGMAAVLRAYSIENELAALPRSKRLCWSLRFPYSAGGQQLLLPLRLVYSERFSEANPAVGLVLEGAEGRIRQAIRTDPRCERVIRDDPECKSIYIIRPAYRPGNPSAAAAELEGFVGLLDQLDPGLFR